MSVRRGVCCGVQTRSGPSDGSVQNGSVMSVSFVALCSVGE